MENTFLYNKIYELLKTEILSERYENDAPFPSERILAERFQASHLTIRKALKILVEDGLIERKSGIGTVVLPSQPTTQTIQTRLSSVSVVLERIDEFSGAILTILENELRKRHIKMMVYCHHLDRQLEKDVYNRATEVKDSVILFFSIDSVTPWLAAHEGAPRTIVASSSEDTSLPQVHTDDETGSMVATTSLINLGYGKIAHICSDYKPSGSMRKNGYLAACANARMEVDDGLVENGSFTLEGGYNACRKIMKSHPDCRAFFCANDYSAYGAINCLREYGLRFGEDYSIIGFGNTPSSGVIRLSSVDQNINRLVSCHINLIEEFMLKGRIHTERFLIPTELVVRDSCVKAQLSIRTGI